MTDFAYKNLRGRLELLTKKTRLPPRMIEWSESEIKTLREVYPEGKWPVILDRLYGRSRTAIMSMASTQKIKRNLHKKYQPSPEIVPLVERRKNADITQAEFADVSGYGTDTIARIESGKKKPNKFHLQVYRGTLERFGV